MREAVATGKRGDSRYKKSLRKKGTGKERL